MREPAPTQLLERQLPERTVVLPKAAKVIDAFTGAEIGDGVMQFKVKIGQYDTGVYFIK